MNEVPRNEIKLDDLEIAKLNAVHAHAAKDKAMDLGKIGAWLGGPKNAPVNIAGFTVVACVLVLTALCSSECTRRHCRYETQQRLLAASLR
jgi:hypothetical protein